MKHPESRFTAIAALLLLTLAVAACGKHNTQPDVRLLDPVAVETTAATAGKRAVTEQVVGTVRPKLQATVTPKIAGRIETLSATPGTRVTSGQPVAELAAGELQASVARAGAALEQAQRERKRYQNLLGQKAVTQSDFDAVDSQFRMAKATLDETKAMAAYATVTAPFSGVITRKFQEPGDMASPGQPIFELEDASQLQLVIDVAESLAGKLALGDSFEVTVEGAGTKLKGALAELSPSADVLSRTFQSKLDLPPHPDLRSGQFGRAALPRGERLAVMVPASALIRRGQIDYVFTAAEGLARLRIVRAGEESEGMLEILSGLNSGEIVIVNPPDTLRDGQPLKN